MWSEGGRRRSGGVGTCGTRGACRRVVGWLGSGLLGVRHGLSGSERLRAYRLLLRWHIDVDGEVVVGGGWMI